MRAVGWAGLGVGMFFSSYCYCRGGMATLFLSLPSLSPFPPLPCRFSLPLYSPVHVLALSFGVFVIENETESLACSSVCLLIGNTN